MENRVRFHHFMPASSDVRSCSQILEKLDDLAPSDSYVSAIIDKMADGTYRTVISVKAVCGKFYSEAVNFSLKDSLKQAQGSMLNSFEEWKSRRFRI